MRVSDRSKFNQVKVDRDQSVTLKFFPLASDFWVIDKPAILNIS